MLAFLLNNKSAEEVKKSFELIKKTLGLELFKRYFQCILTDNGTEFTNPLELEFDMLNGKKSSRFFIATQENPDKKEKLKRTM